MRILVVDDDPAVRSSLDRALRLEGGRAVGQRVGLGLAEHYIRQDLARPGRCAAHHCGGGLVATGFDAEDKHKARGIKCEGLEYF